MVNSVTTVLKRVSICICTALLFASISGCTSQAPSTCDVYQEVCDTLDKEKQTDVIVSLKLATDMDEFKTFLTDHNIAFSNDYEVTNQILVTINKQDLDMLSESTLVDTIHIDSFYPR